MAGQIVEIPYCPRPLQRELHQQRARHRWNVWVCHRRFGKTVLCINELIKCALSCDKPNPRFAYIAPLYKQAKSVAWDYLKHYTGPIPGVVVNESELRVDLPNGARVRLFGADSPDSLRGIYLDGVVLDEYAQMAPRLFGEVIRPALTDRKGWAVFIGTPQGHNGFYDVYQHACGTKGWHGAMFRASDTNIIDADELLEARRDMSEDEYEQEFECSFSAAIRGAYYGSLINEAETDGRIADLPYDPAVPVSTAWDIGIGDDTSIWFFQQIGQRIHVIDHYSANGHGLDHYAKVLEQRAYSYGLQPKHLGPHDVRAREWGSGRTREEQAKALGLKFSIVPQGKVDDGINAVRAILPRCVFDAEKCADGIEALRQYRREFDEKKNTFRDTPLHDWSSHAADAFRTLAMGVRDQYVAPQPRFTRTFNEELMDHISRTGEGEGARI